MTKEPYFIRVMKQSPTEFWINNPTRRQADMAIANSATGCTNNPSFTQKMLDHPEEGEYALKHLDEAVQETDSDWECAEVFQRKMVKPIAEKFLPIYERTGGIRGHVSIQGDPINEDDPDVIVRDAFANRKVAPNICCKIPTTTSGLQAMELMIEENVPINATEIFGVSQMVAICEKYLEISKRVGKKPAFYMSHIAGIYDDHLKDYVEKNDIDISPDVLYQGGLAVARKVYDIMIKRNYPCSFIGGGARGLQHFTEMIGGKACITINWEGTADKLLEQDPPVVWRLFNPVSQYVIDELMEKLPPFKKGYLDDGLEEEEFEHFGPVMLFRDSFIKSWEKAIRIAKDRRTALVNA